MLRTPSQRIGYFACGVAIALGCAAYYWQLWPNYDAFSRDIDPKCRAKYCDFTYYYYKQSQCILTDDTPVKKYYYSPTFALLLVPIGRLPLDEALTVWGGIQAASLLLLITASVLLLRRFPVWTHALLLLLTLTSYPILNNWKWGQANTTFMALIVLALALAERGWFGAAALSLSLVVASRYYPIIYALGFLARRRTKVLIWCAVLALSLAVALPVIAMGAEHAWNYYQRSAASIDEAVRNMTRSRGSLYLPTTVRRLARLTRRDPVWSYEVWKAIAAALAGCNAATVLWAAHKRVPHRVLWAFCFCALSTPLLAPTSWVHYFVYLPLVQTFIAAQLASLRAPWPLRAAGLGLIWLPSVTVTTIFYFEAKGSSQAFVELGYVLFADLALLALAYGLFGRTLASAAAGQNAQDLDLGGAAARRSERDAAVGQ